jgi:hypothetical protein
MDDILCVFFDNPVTRRLVVRCVQGNLSTVERVLALLATAPVQITVDTDRISICEGLLYIRHSAMPSLRKLLPPAEHDRVFVQLGSIHTAPLDIPFTRKKELWEDVLRVNGPSFAYAHVSFNFWRQQNRMWLEKLNSLWSFHARVSVIANTGHFYIDFALRQIATVINTLPRPQQDAIWALLAIPCWQFDFLPEGWVDLEEKLHSEIHVIKGNNPRATKLTHAILLPGTGRDAQFVRCYAPHERTRLALLFLFMHRYRINAERRRRVILVQLAAQAPGAATRPASLPAFPTMPMPDAQKVTFSQALLDHNPAEDEDAECEPCWTTDAAYNLPQTLIQLAVCLNLRPSQADAYARHVEHARRRVTNTSVPIHTSILL